MHQDRTQREDIRGRSHLARPLELFGCHEGRRTDQLAGLGAHFAVRRPGDAEVDDFRTVGGQQHVSRLEIAVHHPRAMDVAQCLGEPRGQPPHLRDRQRAVPLHMVGEGRAGNVEGRHPRAFGIRVGVHDGCREGTADPPRGGHLLPEPPTEFRVLGEFGMDDLDRELESGGRARQMDHAHTAGAEPCLQAVLAGVFRMLRFRADPGIAQRWHGSHPRVVPLPFGRRCDARSLVDGAYERSEAC